ncbi:hypothetical protein OG21DRAFT_1479187 [Imleria badia]|nr:hypothetical protein OG21DRAFT_1479187 [Imleria badia]
MTLPSSPAWKRNEPSDSYRHGSKLLVSEVRITARLQWKGESLIRCLNLLELVPFAFSSFFRALKKSFSNMLPSTFEQTILMVPESIWEEKQRKHLKVRLEMAKFLQETLRESGHSNHPSPRQDAFKDFFRTAHSTGEPPSAADIIYVAKSILVMYRYMAINAFETDNVVRDDEVIYGEGAHCQSRGIHATIRLHLHCLSLGFFLSSAEHCTLTRSYVDGKTAVMQSLESLMCGLPDDLLNETELEIYLDNKQKREMLLVSELVENEQEQEQKEEELRHAKREADEPEASQTNGAYMRHSELICHGCISFSERRGACTTIECQWLKELAQALSIILAKSSVLKEHDELHALMEQYLQAEEMISPDM